MITDKTSPNSLYLIVRKPFEVLFGSKSNTKKRRSLLIFTNGFISERNYTFKRRHS